jgi:hypothetical protein
MAESSHGAEAQPPLPELHEGDLDREGVLALVRDLEALTTIREVVLKRGAGVRVDGVAETPLSEAAAMLLGGRVRGVQVRYAWEGAEWLDTLLATPGGVKLVRIRQNFNSTSA